MAVDAIELRRAHEGDIAQILELLRVSLGETPVLRRTPELFAWKHQRNPFGQSILIVAQSGERIAGLRAMMRWDLLTPDGSTVRCVRPVDTATHPDFARRGIFRSLTMTALDVAREEGIELVFNTPNERSGAGYAKMGWQEVGRIGVLARPRLFAAVKPKVGQLPTIATQAPTAERFQVIDVEPRSPAGLRTPRTMDYQRWRFEDHPTARYGWVPADGAGGVVVRPSVRGSRSELVVSDLLGEADGSHVRQAIRASRARYVAGWFVPGSPERRAAIVGGMMPVPFLKPLKLMALPLVDMDIDLLDMRSWDFATSDLEIL